MRYVWLMKVLLIFVLESSVVWHLRGDGPLLYEAGYHFHLSKMSRVCTFIAETCGKCTQLKSCFWCANDGAGHGSCYAETDLVAKQKCGKVSGYWEKEPCAEVSEEYMAMDESAERSVLIKLLLLLRKLRDSKNKHNNEQENKENSLLTRYEGKVHNKNIAQVQNKESRNEIGNISNSSMMDNNNNRDNNHKHSGSLVVIHNVSTSFDNNNISTSLHNRTRNKTKNVSATNTTPTVLGINNLTISTSFRIPCYGMNQSWCLRKPSCSWCRNNGTCCSSRWKRKEKIVLPHVVSKSGAQLICPQTSSCETCVTNIRCYWCGKASSCNVYPGKSYVNAECHSNVNHKTCSQDIPVYVFALCIILVTFFLSVGYLCARKCYYFQLKPVEVKLEERPILFKKKNGRTVYQITESEEEDEEELYRSGKDSYTLNKVGAAPNNPAVW